MTAELREAILREIERSRLVLTEVAETRRRVRECLSASYALDRRAGRR